MNATFDKLPDNVLSKIFAYTTATANEDKPVTLKQWRNSHLPLAHVCQKWRSADIPFAFDSLYLYLNGKDPTTKVLDGKVVSERTAIVTGNLNAILHHLPVHKPTQINISICSDKDLAEYLHSMLFILEGNKEAFSSATYLNVRVASTGIGYYGRPASSDIDKAKKYAHRIRSCMPNVRVLTIQCWSKDIATRKFVKTLVNAYHKQIHYFYIHTNSVGYFLSYLPVMGKMFCRLCCGTVFKGKRARPGEELKKN